MGQERDTAVSGSEIDLLHRLDLPDPRLSRAFKGWISFSSNNIPQLTRIGLLETKEIANLTRELSNTISGFIGVTAEGNYLNVVSEEKITQLKDAIGGKGNRTIFMRHGEQSPPEWIYSLSNPALRKIRMMRNPFNSQDLLTNNGLIDVFVTALALRYVQVATGKRIRLFSSENLRAKEAAYIISTVIPGSGVVTLEGLSCITYKDETDQPPMSEEDLLIDLPSGTMPWDPRLVDELCKKPKSGMSPSEAIINVIGGLVDYGERQNGNKLAIVLTHNQQIAEVLKEAGKLGDPGVRFSELSMIVLQDKREPLVLNKGILREKIFAPQPRISGMRKVLNIFGEGYEWYKIRREEYQTQERIPFRVSPSPLSLSKKEAQELLSIGSDIADFVMAADELYRTEGDLKELLDRGKPKLFTEDKLSRYLFIRSDVIITPEGFSVCEIETSPFGLALAEMMNRAYRFAGFDTLVADNVLTNFLVGHTPDIGTIVHSRSTASYEGQLKFLAERVLSGNGRKWNIELADGILDKMPPALYRGFYQHEYLVDPSVESVVSSCVNRKDIEVFPSFTPHLEEKALMALIWDKRWESFLSKQLGTSTIGHLRRVVPPTWIIGQEEFFLPGLPGGIGSSEGLASLSKSNRNFVLKKSGFGNGCSWGEGVSFLQEKSSIKAQEVLHFAAEDISALYIIQAFKEGVKRRMFFEEDKSLTEMDARIRVTPYFAMIGKDYGKLIAIKATGCEKTNYIHATTGSINTAVAQS